nr:hypothetical protein LNSESKQC_LNSESKQC_CDS_0007 [Microvirus sp.]
MKRFFKMLLDKLKNETYIFIIAVLVLIATFVTAVSCSHFSMKIGELKDAEVVMETGTAQE